MSKSTGCVTWIIVEHPRWPDITSCGFCHPTPCQLNCLLIEGHWKLSELRLLFFNCARWTGLWSLFIIVKGPWSEIWAGIIKQLFGQLLVRYLIYLARENWCRARLTLLPISALLCQIDEISDSSRPNYCMVSHVVSVCCLRWNLSCE